MYSTRRNPGEPGVFFPVSDSAKQDAGPGTAETQSAETPGSAEINA